MDQKIRTISRRRPLIRTVSSTPAIFSRSRITKDKGIAVYKIPERIEIIAAIPRNPVGKILKSVLREDIRKKLISS
jgi:non-ribosomal peptide synthetase component E (peptide arylation enzyme)